MKKPKILFVADAYVPGYSSTIFRFAKCLVNKGHNVYVLAGRFEKDITFSTEDEGINFYNYSYPYGRDNLLFILKMLYENFKIFKKINQDIQFDFICFFQPLSALEVLFNKTFKAITKIYFFLGPWDREYELNVQIDKINKLSLRFFWYKVNSYLKRLCEDIALRHCKKIIVASNFMQEQLIKKHKIKSYSIEIIPGCVDTDKFKPAQDKENINNIRRILGLPKDKKIILTVRRLVPRMGLDNLILAMDRIIKKIPDVYLVIVGEGFLMDSLKKMVSDLGLQEFIGFTGNVQPEDSLVLFYQAADLFVLPTRELEGFGMIIIEALSCGLCILATPVGAIPEVLSGFNRDLLFKGIKPQDIAELTIRYIEDNKLREGVASRGRDYILKNYSLEVIGPKLEQIFK